MRVLRVTVLLAIAAFVVHAVFTQWYETGPWRFIAPFLPLGFVGCLVAFLLRKPWSWRAVAWIVAIGVGINLIFWPEARHYGESLGFARWVLGIEAALCAAIGVLMMKSSTKRWFHGQDAG